MGFFGQYLALIGLATPLAFSALLDRHLKADLKQRLSAYVFGAGTETVSHRVSLFSALLASALGVGPARRTFRLFVIGFLSIAFVYSLQYFVRYDQFAEDTLPFLKSVASLRPFAIYVLLSFAAVDAISFFQTATFSRLAAYCKNPIEVMFLAFADVVVSLFLVIIFLPMFLFASYSIATAPHDVNIKVALVEALQPQQFTISDIVMMAAPRIADAGENTIFDEAEATAQQDWIYSNPRVFVQPGHADLSLETAARGRLPSAGGTLVFVKGDLSSEEVAVRLASILASNDNVDSASVLESSSDLFGNGVYSFAVQGRSEYSGFVFLTSYRSIMGDVNFFGDGFYDVFSLGSKTFDENEITYTGMLTRVVINREGGQVVYTCDDGPVKTVDRVEFLKLPKSACSRGVAMSEWSVAGIASLLSYNLEDELNIPVLPTALSSVVLTVIIYASIMIWILLPYITAFADRYTNEGAKFVTDHVFTISFVLIMFIFAPMIYLGFAD